MKAALHNGGCEVSRWIWGNEPWVSWNHPGKVTHGWSRLMLIGAGPAKTLSYARALYAGKSYLDGEVTACATCYEGHRED